MSWLSISVNISRFVKSDGLKKVMALILPNYLCKCWEKTTTTPRNRVTSFIIVDSLFSIAAANFLLELGQISFRNNAFIQEFYFDTNSSRMLELSVSLLVGK